MSRVEQMVECTSFTCLVCKTHGRWGSRRNTDRTLTRYCNGYVYTDTGTRRCSFKWAQSEDHKYLKPSGVLRRLM